MQASLAKNLFFFYWRKRISIIKTVENRSNDCFVPGMVSALDESVRQIVTTLKRKGLYDNSIIVFTTDNGGAAGGLDSSAGSNYPLRGAKNTLWEGGVRAVGFVHSPLLKKRGKIEAVYSLYFPSIFLVA